MLVDTSLWIELSRRGLPQMDDRALEEAVTCGPVVQELLQGVRPEHQAALEYQLASLPLLCDPLPVKAFHAAARIYRAARERGLTIRSSVDCLIAAVAIDSGVELWHNDRDFETIAQFTPLRQRRIAAS